MAHEHAGTAHEHAAGEEFPRAETGLLVGKHLRGESRRARLQDGLIALALALLALGLPLERLLGRGPAFVEGLARRLEGFSGPALERAAFLAAAASFALGWLVLVRAARRAGWESGPALRASSIAACAPVVVLAATTPGPAAAGWLGACLVLATLVPETTGPRLRALAWLAAATLHPWNLWLWPAWWLRERRAGRRWCAGAGLLAALALLARVGPRPSEAFAGLDGGPGPLVAWWTLWIAGLGGASFAVLALARGCPHWLLAYALVPLVPLSLGGTIAHDLAWLWLAPLGWLGALELEKRGRRTGGLLAGSLALAAAALAWARTTDPERSWRALAEERLEPGDLVLTHSPAHRYLLATRNGLEVIVLPARGAPPPQPAERVRTAREAGRRVVLDEGSLQRAGEPLADTAACEWATRAADLRLGAR